MGVSDDQESTYFAPAQRADPRQLRQNINMISRNPLVNTILKSVSGLLAVLNEQRQILAVNELMLESLGIDGSKLGLRHGEAIDCVHAQDHPGGCGTSQACMSCGAAIAIMTALNSDSIIQQDCFITLERQGQPLDYYFQVQCSPLVLEGRRFLLLFLIDVTNERKFAALERAFFHDIKNLIASLVFSADQLQTRVDDPELRRLVARHLDTVARLNSEVEIQRVLCDNRMGEYQVTRQNARLSEVVATLQDLFSDYRVALQFEDPPPALSLCTDVNLLQRVLTNMVINALEASEEDDTVRLWVEFADGRVTFCVWNRAAIPRENIPRIFQRNFSTKPGTGRGLGTYTMKLFGETYLGGTVDFTSSEQAGTVFCFSLPVTAASASA